MPPAPWAPSDGVSLVDTKPEPRTSMLSGEIIPQKSSQNYRIMPENRTHLPIQSSYVYIHQIHLSPFAIGLIYHNYNTYTYIYNIYMCIYIYSPCAFMSSIFSFVITAPRRNLFVQEFGYLTAAILPSLNQHRPWETLVFRGLRRRSLSQVMAGSTCLSQGW